MINILFRDDHDEDGDDDEDDELTIIDQMGRERRMNNAEWGPSVCVTCRIVFAFNSLR